MKRKKRIIPVVLLIAGVAALGVSRIITGNSIEFRSAAVERGDIVSVVSSTGLLQATRTVQVGTQVSGQIAEIYADFNDHVTAGQLIARIDPTLLEQEVASAETAVQRAAAERDHARSEMDRIQNLFEASVITEKERATAAYELAVAEASLKSAEINLERARRNLGYSEIRSPISGVVLERSVDVGQTVAASFSAPQLFLIAEDLSSLEILASVDQSDIGDVRQGQRVRFTVQTYPDETFEGTVSQVRLQSSTQENVVNYTVVIDVRNTTGRLLPGMTATAEFVIQEASDVLKVPNTALRFRPTGAMRKMLAEQRSTADRPGFVARAEAAGAGGQEAGKRSILWSLDAKGGVRPVAVQAGLTDGQYTAVEGDGIHEGMQVVTAAAEGASSSSSSSTNPFQNERQGFRGPPPPGM